MSSDDMAVAAHELGKKYKVYSSPIQRIREGLSFGKKSFHKAIWALRDVSFELPRGRAMGVIGSNGAGKSTLLKILAGTTLSPPAAQLRDQRHRRERCSSWGPASTPSSPAGPTSTWPRQVHGVPSRAQIENKIDEIIEFAELGEYIDQPVRTYSSGMIMRLGFSVATAVDPDVLIIDEILAVGDMHFQKKCVDRIFQFREAGKTIIFCSHSMYDVQQVCDEVIWIKDGRIEQRGTPIEITAEYANYERSLDEAPGHELMGLEQVQKENPPRLDRVVLVDDAGEPVSEVDSGVTLAMQLDYHVPETFDEKLNCGFAIWRSDNVLIASATSHHDRVEVPRTPGGKFRVNIRVPRLDLLTGEYTVIGYIYDDSGLHIYDHRINDLPLVIKPSERHGVLSLNHTWEFQER